MRGQTIKITFAVRQCLVQSLARTRSTSAGKGSFRPKTEGPLLAASATRHHARGTTGTIATMSVGHAAVRTLACRFGTNDRVPNNEGALTKPKTKTTQPNKKMRQCAHAARSTQHAARSTHACIGRGFALEEGTQCRHSTTVTRAVLNLKDMCDPQALHVHAARIHTCTHGERLAAHQHIDCSSNGSAMAICLLASRLACF